jgi:hypothetical protein
MIMYRACTYRKKPVEKVEVIKRTTKKVFYEEKDYWNGKPINRQAFMDGRDTSYFDTFAQAKKWLMDFYDTRIKGLESQWQSAKSSKQTINNLREEDL